MVEAVAGLALPRRRPLGEHPGSVALDAIREVGRRERPRRSDGRQDAPACGVELLVARAAGAERELRHTVTAECRVRVAVDEPGNGAQPGAVELLHVAGDRREVAHPSDRCDRRAAAEHVGILDHAHRTEVGAARHRPRSRGRRDLCQVAKEQISHRQPDASNIGVERPCSRAAASASG